VTTRARAFLRHRTLLRSVSAAAALLFIICTEPSLPAAHRAQLSRDLQRFVSGRASSRTHVIVTGARPDVSAIAARHHVTVIRWLHDGAVVSANAEELDALAADPGVAHLSGDPIVTPTLDDPTRSTAADQAWSGSRGLFGIGGIPGVDGDGVGVAVVDSGIAPHRALRNRVVASVSFVSGDPTVDDAFGHGTHVAGIIAGDAAAAAGVTDAYAGGIAPGARLINVRVLGASGAGLTSDVIAGIDWVIANQSTYNIRVLNLSLGHPVMEPAATDPLCQAVARAVEAGIAVVTAAGNAGETADGATVLGGITSPGNSPFAITVGALDTWGTVARGDDSVASYSSRGPTKYDLAIKPDLVAPGTHIVSTEAAGSYLAADYPMLHLAGSGRNAYMRLSGTSMAAPMVSGAAALLLQGAPRLTTTQLKLALQSGAGFVRDAGLMGAGAGSLNVWASRRITANGLTALLDPLFSTLVGGSQSGSSGASFLDAGTLSARLYDGRGIRLLSLLDALHLWNDPSRVRYGDLNLVGVLNPLSAMSPNDLQWGEVATWYGGDEIVWGTSFYSPRGDEIVWGTWGNDEIVWGTDTLTAEDAR
jgi:serine protease AprX